MNTKLNQLFDKCKLSVDYSCENDKDAIIECTCYVANAPEALQPNGIQKNIPYAEFQKRFSDTKDGQVLVTDPIDPQESYYMPFWKWFSDMGWKAQTQMFETFLNEKEGRTEIWLPKNNELTYEQAKEACGQELPDVFASMEVFNPNRKINA